MNTVATRGLMAKRRPEIERLLREGVSVTEIARRFEARIATVQHHARPIIDRLRADGVRCGCGREIAHPSKCTHNGSLGAEQLALRARVISLLAAGTQVDVVAQMVKRTTTSIERYIRYLTPAQAENRRLCRRRRPSASAPVVAPKPISDAIYARFSALVSRHLPDHLRDDVLSEMYLAVMEGADPDVVAGEVRRFTGQGFRMWASKFGPRSLNEARFEDGDDLIHSIPDPAAIAAFDRLDNLQLGRVA